MVNRLSASMSPYLQQHADNPVDWWEWQPEAFAQARSRDVPVLLSVGYAACHWCHVMAHESFEDAATAAFMNDSFVNVKVDREERPDIDAVYMSAVQAMTGHGGWPMTVFLTPDAEPFFAGTYFPPVPRHGSASFPQVLEAVSDAWLHRRDAVKEAGKEAVRRLASMQQPEASESAPDADLLASATRSLVRSFDPVNAGFGSAPKFPPSMTLEHLLRHHARTGDADALVVAQRTLEAMARGGIYDQLGGGFARYSVDAEWVVPHFEKMLYDNALLLQAYVSAYRITGDRLARRIADETADFMVSELRTPEGGFASSLDADTEGHEGRYYVWSRAELDAALGAADGAWAADLFSVTETGTFEQGASVLQLRRDPDDLERWAEVRRRLAAERARRTAPGRDDKIVAAWNGLAIAALAQAGAVLGRRELVDAASGAASLLLEVHTRSQPQGLGLVRTSRAGVASRHAGVLEDYGCLAEGLLTLYSVKGDTELFVAARGLMETVLNHFVDHDGQFVDTADDAEPLITRPADPADNASPSGRSAAAAAFVTLAGLTGEDRYRAAAELALGASASLARTAPRFAGWALAAAEALAAGPVQVAIVGPADDPATTAMLEAAWLLTSPGAVVAWGEGADPSAPPLMQGRGMIGGRPAAYPCRGFVCQLPVTDPSALRSGVDAMASPT